MFDSIIMQHFSKLENRLQNSFTRNVNGCISSCSFSTHEIARSVSKATGKDFNTSEKGLIYLLSSDNFQIDDQYWRMHINMVFSLLAEQNLIHRDDKIYIQVDFTSNKDDFLILCASIIFHNKAIPLYFTMRNYPKRKNQYNQKKMELAFIKGLRHALSKKYQYVIVCDRGFSNKRFLELCESQGFDYMIRFQPNMSCIYQSKEGLMEEIVSSDGRYDLELKNWNKHLSIYRCSNEKGVWYLASNINDLTPEEAVSIYRDRFKIEKCFQDMKSSGFKMEQSRIRKYSRYKKLLAMCMVAHSLLVLLGHCISSRFPGFLKNSALKEQEVSAYFQLDGRHATYFQKSN